MPHVAAAHVPHCDRSDRLLSQTSVGQALSALPGFQEDGEPVEEAHQAEFEQ